MTHEKIVTVYDNRAHAEAAKEKLVKSGLAVADISILSFDDFPAETPLKDAKVWAKLLGKDLKEEEAKAYAKTVADGGCVLVVRSLEPEKAANLLKLAEEQLEVGKKLVDAGGVRIRRFVVEKPVEAKVTLHEEHVEVARKAIDDPKYLDDVDWSDKVIEMRESAEEAVVTKTVHLKEEVGLKKVGSDHVETIKDTVRHQEVKVEDLPAEKVEVAEEGVIIEK